MFFARSAFDFTSDKRYNGQTMEENKPAEEIEFVAENVEIVNEAPKAGGKFSTPLSIVIAGVIIAGAILFTHFSPASNTNVGAGTTGAQAKTLAVDIKKVKTDGEPFVGQADAPVTMAYWSDYQCPFCKRFEQDTLTQIMKNYVAAGKVKIVFKDFPFLGNDSITGALYARAVWELYPSQYFAWRTAMFDKQDQEGDQGFGNDASVKELTGTIPGIDGAKVAALVVQKKDAYQKELDADKAEGSAFGIQGTPSFIIGTTLIPGAVPYTQISAALDAQIK